MRTRKLAASIMLGLGVTGASADIFEPIATPIPVDTIQLGQITGSAVASTSLGESVIVWASEDQITGQSVLKMQRFTAWGSPNGAPQLVAGPGAGIRHPSVDVDIENRVFIAWQQDGIDGDGSAILTQVFDLAEQTLTGVTQVNQTTTGDQQEPTVKVDHSWGSNASGQYVVTWDSPAIEGGYAAMARVLAVSGDSFGHRDEFRANPEASLVPTKPKAHIWSDSLSIHWIGPFDTGSEIVDQVWVNEFYVTGEPWADQVPRRASNTFQYGGRVSDLALDSGYMSGEYLVFVEDGQVYYKRDFYNAQKLSSNNATDCRDPAISLGDFGHVGITFACTENWSEKIYVAMDRYGHDLYPTTSIADALTGYGNWDDLPARAGGIGVDIDGNAILSIQPPEGYLNYDDNLLAMRVRGYAEVPLLFSVSTPGTVAPGANLGFTATIKNDFVDTSPPGHHDGRGLALHFTVPAGTSFLSATGQDWVCQGETDIICRYEQMLNGKQSTKLSVQTTGLDHFATIDIPVRLSTYVNSLPVEPTATAQITVGVPDASPDPITLQSYDSVPRSTTVGSNFTVTGINTEIPISVQNGSFARVIPYDIEYTDSVRNGDQIVVWHQSADTLATTTTTTLTVGDQTVALISTTEATDTVPDPYDLIDVTNVPLGSLQTSNAVVVNGTTHATAISIVGGDYAINGGAFTTASGQVNPGDSVVVRHTAATTLTTITTTTLTIGGISADFKSTTTSTDAVPNAFAFTDATNVALNTVITSGSITVQGINTAVPITVSGGAYSINNGVFVTTPGMVSNGATVRVQHTSAPTFSTQTSTDLTIGGISAAFRATTLAADTTPNVFSFPSVTNQPRNSTIQSAAATISGINTAAPISVTNGSYSINNGPFVSTPGTIEAGAQVRLQQTTSSAFSTNTITTVQIGSFSTSFMSTTEAQDTTPNPFDFPDLSNVARNATQTSAPIVVSGINAPASINIAFGSYAVNGGAFTTSPGTVNAGDSVQVRHVSASAFGTSTNTTLFIGGVSSVFSSVTEAEDLTPNAFDLIDVVNVPRNSMQTSSPIVIGGINAATPISVVGGSYSINGGAFVTTAGSVNNGDSVRVQHQASGSFSTQVTTMLNINGISADFSSQTEAADTTPSAFAWADQTGLQTNAVVTSAPISVAGINAPAAISVSGGSYSINGGTFVSAEGTVNAGDQVRVRTTTASTANTAVNVVLTIGGVSDTFSATTGTADSTPNAFSFVDVTGARRNKAVTSGSVAISGINVAVPIAVSGSGVKYSKNGGAFTTSPGTIVNGDQIRLQLVASGTANTTLNATVTIGGVTDVWSVTTSN